MELPTYAIDYRTGAIISKGDWPGCLSASSIALPYDAGENGVRGEVVRRLNDYPAKAARIAELEAANDDLRRTIREQSASAESNEAVRRDACIRAQRVEAENAALKAACVVKDEALRGARPIVNAHYDHGDDDYGNTEVVKALGLIETALSTTPAKWAEYVKGLEAVVEPATHVWQDRTYEGGWMAILEERLDALRSKPDYGGGGADDRKAEDPH